MAADYLHNLQFEIDSDLRVIAIPKKGVVAGVEGDKDVNRIAFKIDKMYNGFDLSEFDFYINYKNVEGTKGRYVVMDKTPENELILFSWLVSDEVTAAKGTVTFAVELINHEESADAQRFNTTIGQLQVLEGLNSQT
ncbi:MAG: hypothetical protein J6U54_09650 [Clostridiales bacterium]|nr:hypothetical protein [Clostridiales bacterium]